MRFQDAAPDARAIVYAGIQADALVAAFELPLPAPELEGMLIETLALAVCVGVFQVTTAVFVTVVPTDRLEFSTARNLSTTA